jgi:hypothetical protein
MSDYFIKQRFNSHSTSTNLPFIKVMGTPLSKFNSDEYVTMELLTGKRGDGEEKRGQQKKNTLISVRCRTLQGSSRYASPILQ